MIDTNIVTTAKAIAATQSLDPMLVCAVCEQESGWNQYTIRYEPLFMSKYVAPLYTNNKLSATEAFSRAFSWGVMQLMGQVAREAGFLGPFPQLCDPNIGILWGCRVLAKKLALHPKDVNAGLLAWNGGGNPVYGTQVIARMASYRA